MIDKAEQFYDKLCKAVQTDQLKLPTLPEVALKIRQAVESEEKSAQQIAEILTQDASLAARLLQLANSPLYRARSKIDNLQLAITRLGTRVVKDLVITLAMKQIFQSTSKSLDQQFRELWSTSVEVAAICRMLATSQKSLEPEQALLAGLIHNIGALPILRLAEDDDELIDDPELLQEITLEIQSKVGKVILEFWDFPDTFLNVVKHWDEFDRQHPGVADYTDLVQVAILQSGHTQFAHTPAEWNQISAFQKLGLDATINYTDKDDNKASIEETRQTLMAM
ncbi:MAG: HDOD domain-containing protein [Gammaproteobacteria bacterium]|nr:HDOD domain-containing protein [Gammaproteobacteria bacterium]